MTKQCCQPADVHQSFIKNFQEFYDVFKIFFEQKHGREEVKKEEEKFSGKPDRRVVK
jgi:hypothetical protein